jgi:phage-related holin
MEFNVVNFVNNLTIVQMVIFIVFVELLEVTTGILRAWQEDRPIKSAITRQGIVKKFELWKYIFVMVTFAMWVGQDAIAKMLLVFVIIPELTSILENIIRSFKEDVGDK